MQNVNAEELELEKGVYLPTTECTLSSPEPVILLVCAKVSSLAQTKRIAGSGDESVFQCSLLVITVCYETSVTCANLHSNQ